MDEHLSIFRRDVIPGRKPHWVNIGFVESSKVGEAAQAYAESDDMRPIMFMVSKPVDYSDEYLEALYARTMAPVGDAYKWSNN